MLRKFIVSLALVALSTSLQAQESDMTKLSDENQLRSVHMQVVMAMFFKPDHLQIEKLLDKNATRKSGPPGSALGLIQGVKRGGLALANQGSIHEISFFTKQSLPELQKRYPKLRFLVDENRMPKHIKDGVGCLIVLKALENGKVLKLGLVANKVDGEFKIVHTEDEP